MKDTSTWRSPNGNQRIHIERDEQWSSKRAQTSTVVRIRQDGVDNLHLTDDIATEYEGYLFARGVTAALQLLGWDRI